MKVWVIWFHPSSIFHSIHAVPGDTLKLPNWFKLESFLYFLIVVQLIKMSGSAVRVPRHKTCQSNRSLAGQVNASLYNFAIEFAWMFVKTRRLYIVDPFRNRSRFKLCVLTFSRFGWGGYTFTHTAGLTAGVRCTHYTQQFWLGVCNCPYRIRVIKS